MISPLLSLDYFPSFILSAGLPPFFFVRLDSAARDKVVFCLAVRSRLRTELRFFLAFY